MSSTLKDMYYRLYEQEAQRDKLIARRKDLDAQISDAINAIAQTEGEINAVFGGEQSTAPQTDPATMPHKTPLRETSKVYKVLSIIQDKSGHHTRRSTITTLVRRRFATEDHSAHKPRSRTSLMPSSR